MTQAEERYEVVAVRYGTRVGHKSEIYLNYGVYREPDLELGMDYYFWVIRNRYRTVVVDCGFNAGSGASRGRTMLCDPADALVRLGVVASDISAVIVTHAHYDHIGNLGLFPGVPVVMSENEYLFWTGPMATRAQFAHSSESADVQSLRSAEYAGLLHFAKADADGTEVFPGISVRELGGHTPGQLVVVVKTDGGEVMLASDSLHYYEELDRDWPFAHVADLRGMYAGFDYLREWSAQPGRLLVPGHDPAVMTQFPSFSDELAGLAVVVR